MADPQLRAARAGRHPVWRGLGLAVGGVVTAVLVAGAALSVAAALVVTDETASHTFEGPVRQVVVRVHGSIEVSPGPPDQARVVRRSEFSFRRPTVEQSLVDGVLDVRVRCAGVGFLCDSRLELRVPPGAALDVRARHVHVADTTGPVRVGSGQGAIVLERLAGAIDVDLAAGAIDGRALASAEVRVRNGAGHVRLAFASAPTVVEASTGAGYVEVELPPGEEAYRVDAHTGAGDTRVGVRTDPAGSRVIQLRNGAGAIDVRYPPG